MKRHSLYFCDHDNVQLREEDLPEPQAGQVLVQSVLSAISPGTELLVYRGQVPRDLAVDENIAALAGSFRYPLKYGYSSVGRVMAVGSGVDESWLERRVFCFHPHESHYLAAPDKLLPIPDALSWEDAVLLPNMETAVNFVMDGRPLIGESAAVFGLGIVGLLTTALLRQFPLSALVAFDRYANRRAVADGLGAVSYDPAGTDALSEALEYIQSRAGSQGADLVFEVSGNPRALNQAIALTGFSGRVVIGSWYGAKPVELDLGGRFHRSRIHLISSQVSSIATEHQARWSKTRRMSTAWDSLARIHPSRWITQRFPFQQAPEAYRLLSEAPAETIQVVLAYP